MSGEIKDDVWTRSGISLLWDAVALSEIAEPGAVISMRALWQITEEGWPEELPCSDGDALVVAGLDGCLDALPPQESVQWLDSRLYSLLLNFQQEYEGQAALIFWLPQALSRIEYQATQEVYMWKCAGEHKKEKIPLSRNLWNGAQKDARRILSTQKDDNKWIGLYHPRIS